MTSFLAWRVNAAIFEIPNCGIKILRGLPQPFYPDGGLARAASSVSNLVGPLDVGGASE